MQKRVIQILFLAVGASLGVGILPNVWASNPSLHFKFLQTPVGNSLIGAILFFFLSLFLASPIVHLLNKATKFLSKVSLRTLLFGTGGLFLGLLVGGLFSLAVILLEIPYISSVLPIILMALFGYLGFYVSLRRKEDLLAIFTKKKASNEKSKKTQGNSKQEVRSGQSKLLDTSVLIDGRILDVVKTGFIEGRILIPNFVLFELQKISDSSDSLKRNKGRRGLDMIEELQQLPEVDVQTIDRNYTDTTEVDEMLLKCAKEIDGVVVTNDFNLNKVAQIQGIQVLNINELANALKPVVIPGETMEILVVKEGSERNQGIAYLEDGTMIVVEEAKHHINEKMKVEVTSVIQTNAGKMIFAKPE